MTYPDLFTIWERLPPPGTATASMTNDQRQALVDLAAALRQRDDGVLRHWRIKKEDLNG